LFSAACGCRQRKINLSPFLPFLRYEAHDLGAARVLQQQVDLARAAERHVADPREVRQQRFDARDLAVAQLDPQEVRGAQGADDQVAAPLRKGVAAVEHEARDRRRGREVERGRLEPGRVEGDTQAARVVERRAVVVDAARGERPAVVAARA
jgi:hypothetical protein